MTVSSDLKTALASLKSAQASFETFALSTENQEAKTMFTNAAQQAQNLVDLVNPRVQQIENEEPQYKGF
jgi:K+-sensing histidine kinase KdpD